MGRRGRSASSAGDGAHATSDDVQLCGSCCKDVGDTAIGCDECEVWVHNTEMCSGLTSDMIEAIGRYSGAGIKFLCMQCRLDFTSRRGCSPSSSTESHMVELVKHLSQQVKGICSQVQELKNEIKNLSTRPKPAHPDQAPAPPAPAPTPIPPVPPTTYAAAAAADPGRSPQEYRRVVREELRELQEQQKRRTSLVVRGLGARSAEEAVQRFEIVSDHLINQKVTLTDVVKISSESDLYRGKVTDDSARKLILDKAKQLKNSSRFESVFIRRDLTFNQRAEMRARRAAAEADRTAGEGPRPKPANGVSSLPGSGEQQSSSTVPLTLPSSNSQQISDDSAGPRLSAVGASSPISRTPHHECEASNQ